MISFNDRTILAEIAIEALEKKRVVEKELEKYRGKVRHRTQFTELSEGLKNRLGKYKLSIDFVFIILRFFKFFSRKKLH